MSQVHSLRHVMGIRNESTGGWVSTAKNLSEERIYLYEYESRKAGNGIIFSVIGLVSSAVDKCVVSSLLEASLACSWATLCVSSSRANSYAATLAG